MGIVYNDLWSCPDHIKLPFQSNWFQHKQSSYRNNFNLVLNLLLSCSFEKVSIVVGVSIVVKYGSCFAKWIAKAWAKSYCRWPSHVFRRSGIFRYFWIYPCAFFWIFYLEYLGFFAEMDQGYCCEIIIFWTGSRQVVAKHTLRNSSVFFFWEIFYEINKLAPLR